HALAGDWLEAAGERDAMMLAEHFERGRAFERALVHYPRAAVQALEGNDLQGALARAERGVACGASGVVLGNLRATQAEAQNWLGESAEGLRLATEEWALHPPATPAWFVAAKEAIILANQVGDAARVGEIVSALRSNPAEGETRSLRRVALAWGAVCLFFA